jgi:hypothetical protein
MMRRLSPENPGFISVVAVTETAWVLESVYRLSNPEIAVAIERLLEVEVLAFEAEQQVFTAMIAVKVRRAAGRSPMLSSRRLVPRPVVRTRSPSTKGHCGSRDSSTPSSERTEGQAQCCGWLPIAATGSPAYPAIAVSTRRTQ